MTRIADSEGCVESADADTFSVGSGPASSSFQKSFPWLQIVTQNFDGGRNGDNVHISDSTLDKFLEDKRQKILECLSGTNEEIDLWKLRDLCLSKGGLISPQIRKQAWPKLFSASQNIFEPRSNEKECNGSVETSKSDILLLTKDVGRCVWHIEGHVFMARREEENAKGPQRNIVTDLPGLQQLSPDSPPVKSIKAGSDSQSPVSGEMSLSESSQGTIETTDSTVDSMVPAEKSRKYEQNMLVSVILSVLRKKPEENPYFEDDRYHYYCGMSDLAALILINLQSPSLTSLMLRRLGEAHLRDAMRTNAQSLTSALRLSLFPLLKETDEELYDHIGSCIEVPIFPMSWVQTWFSNQLLDVRVASRLIDFFLVSHPLMPIYFTAAFLCHDVNRSKILSTEKTLVSLHELLYRLPLQLIEGEKDFCYLGSSSLADTIEEVLENSLKLMETVTPSRLVEMASQHEQLGKMLPSIGLFQKELPSWSIKSSTPTDWALLQLAKKHRAGGTPEEINSSVNSMNHHPRAMVAVGMKPKTNGNIDIRNHRSRAIVDVGMKPMAQGRCWRLHKLVLLVGIALALYAVRYGGLLVTEAPQKTPVPLDENMSTRLTKQRAQSRVTKVRLQDTLQKLKVTNKDLKQPRTFARQSMHVSNSIRKFTNEAVVEKEAEGRALLGTTGIVSKIQLSANRSEQTRRPSSFWKTGTIQQIRKRVRAMGKRLVEIRKRLARVLTEASVLLMVD